MDYFYIGDGRAIVRLRNGLDLAVPMQDPFIGAPMALARQWDPLLEATVTAMVKPGQRCINVGANIGYFTTLMAHHCGPAGHVYAFEPSTANVDLLCYNLQLNRVSHWVHVYRAAVSNASGALPFVTPASYSDGRVLPKEGLEVTDKPRFDPHGLMTWRGNSYVGAQVEEVPAVTLDHILGTAGPFDFLLCDAEGFDASILLGARHLISRFRERLTIVFEWNGPDFHQYFESATLDRVFNMLELLGYVTAWSENRDWNDTTPQTWKPFIYRGNGLLGRHGNILCRPAALGHDGVPGMAA